MLPQVLQHQHHFSGVEAGRLFAQPALESDLVVQLAIGAVRQPQIERKCVLRHQPRARAAKGGHQWGRDGLQLRVDLPQWAAKRKPMQCSRGKQRTHLRVWTVTARCTLLDSSGCQFTSGLLQGSIHNGSTHLESEEQLHNAWVAQAIQDVPLAPDVLHHLVPAAASTGSSRGLSRDTGDVRQPARAAVGGELRKQPTHMQCHLVMCCLFALFWSALISLPPDDVLLVHHLQCVLLAAGLVPRQHHLQRGSSRRGSTDAIEWLQLTSL